jgi:hypothetical protein
MKKSIAIGILTVAVSCGAYAAKDQIKPNSVVPTIEIKNIRLGMSSDAVYAILGNERVSTFTVGEVGTDSGANPSSSFIDQKLSSFFFPFKSVNFSKVLSAVLSKYPMTQCSNSELTNRMGASFTQVECLLSSKDGIMTLRKYGSTFDSGHLLLSSNEAIEKSKQDAVRKSNDI